METADEKPIEIVRAELIAPRRRRVLLPLLLFCATCFTTFAAGCYQWNAWETPVFGNPVRIEVQPGDSFTDLKGQQKIAKQRSIVWASWYDGLRYNWKTGVVYMVWVMAILLLHEMGHFLMTLRYKIPASFPFFIPVPFMVTGTMGAVIGMNPNRANRKEVFDIGIAGPLAGLVLTIPLLIYGLSVAEPTPERPEARGYGDPLLVKLLIPLLHDLDDVKKDYAEKNNDPSALKKSFTFVVNPIYMAAWVGMLVTGLNMLPVSQLDGGHVSYTLFGPYSRWVARGFMLAAMLFIVWTESYNWTLMLILVLLMGTDHPPTADDRVKLGPLRYGLGLVSLLIPIFCFTPFPLLMGD